jgi:hypothetical protein
MLRVLIATLLETHVLSMGADSSWDRDGRTWTMQPDTFIECSRL